MAGQRRIRVTLTLGPADLSDLGLFTWLLRHVIAMHATAPTALRVRVEMLPAEPPD